MEHIFGVLAYWIATVLSGIAGVWSANQAAYDVQWNKNDTAAFFLLFAFGTFLASVVFLQVAAFQMLAPSLPFSVSRVVYSVPFAATCVYVFTAIFPRIFPPRPR